MNAPTTPTPVSHYDARHDSLYVYCRDVPMDHRTAVGPGMAVDFDGLGAVVGVEFDNIHSVTFDPDLLPASVRRRCVRALMHAACNNRGSE